VYNVSECGSITALRLAALSRNELLLLLLVMENWHRDGGGVCVGGDSA